MSEVATIGSSLRKTYEHLTPEMLSRIALNQVVRKDSKCQSLGVIIDILSKDRDMLYYLDDKVEQHVGKDEVAFYKAQRRQALKTSKK